MAPLDARPSRLDVLRAPDALTLIATVTEPLGAAERLGLACVIATDTELSYWALAHPPGRPDFHHVRLRNARAGRGDSGADAMTPATTSASGSIGCSPSPRSGSRSAAGAPRCSRTPRRGRWFIARLALQVDCCVIEMQGWEPDRAPGYGWPLGERTWINPSPNVPSVLTALLPGHRDGRAHDAVRGPRDDATARAFRRAGHRRAQARHDDALARAALARRLSLWRDFAYEYAHGRLAIDVINGGPLLREWVDDPSAGPGDLDAAAAADEPAWAAERAAFLLY